jgi:hypothetical protein
MSLKNHKHPKKFSRDLELMVKLFDYGKAQTQPYDFEKLAREDL